MILELYPIWMKSLKEKSFLQKNRFVCAIVLHKDHVNLQFARGTEIKDPEKM